jgi:hypothetical protein
VQDSRRKFIWEEMSYLERWWRDAPRKKQEDFAKLVRSGQLEIVSGGWVMNDEVSTGSTILWFIKWGFRNIFIYTIDSGCLHCLFLAWYVSICSLATHGMDFQSMFYLSGSCLMLTDHFGHIMFDLL